MVLQAALVGAGMMGRNHARVLSSLDEVEFAAVVDHEGDPHNIRGNAALLRSLSDLGKLEIDFAVVATPTSTHEEVAGWLLSQGIHVLIEKPVASDTGAGRRLLGVAAEGRCIAAVGHIERFNPAIRELRRRLQLGEIGEVFQIASRRQGSFPSRIQDTGVTKDLASHDIDLTMWIAESRYAEVSAQSVRRSHGGHEDMIVVAGRLENGVIVNHLVNWLSPMKERIVTVTGSQGTFVADTLTGDLTLHENGAFAVEWDSFAEFRGVTEGNVTRFAYEKKEPLRLELESFRDAVLDRGNDYVSISDGLRVLEVADAIVESSILRQPRIV